MRQILMAGMAVAATFCLGLAGAQAQWSMTQRGNFLRDCIPACESNPNVHESRRPQCASFCNCLANEGEKVFSSEEFDEMDADSRAGRESPKTQQFHAMVPACNRQAFGQ